MLSIIGCGNPYRQDDGVGIYVVQSIQKYLKQRHFPGVSAYDAGTAGIEVMFKARGSEELIIVDANLSQSEPGSLFIVPGEELANFPEPTYNLHDFRWDHAIYSGKKIYRDAFPENISVYLIEAASVEMGNGMTELVKATADKVIVMIKEHIQSYAR